MSNEVTERWRGDADIMDLTDTDLESSRNKYTRISDATRELHVLIETLKQHLDMENWSKTCDIAIRTELAYAIDNYEVDCSRERYDIAYTIPPVGYVDEETASSTEPFSKENGEVNDQEYEQVPLVEESEVDTEHRTIGFSTAPVVHEMAKTAVEQDTYDTVSEIVKTGAKRMLGR